MSVSIWVVDDDRSIRWVLEKALGQEGYAVTCFEDADEALNTLEQGGQEPEVLISDVRMPGTDGLRMLKILQRKNPDLPVIIMTAHSDLDSAVASYQGGAFEYLPKPFDVDEAVALVRRAIKHREESRGDFPEPVEEAPTEIIGEAPAMQEVFRAIGRLSHSNVTVLINGQSGTGKELVARALHRHSMRREKNFVALNMAAIPKDLIESELFGHEKGAFTGANNQRVGRFEQANGGTLFLDEIGDMPLEAQTRLLRVLQESEFYRVGGTTPIHVDVRIIAATHQDLEKLVKEGDFREDLFHRLNVIRIHIPRMAERREDIPRLANYFLQRAGSELGVEPKVLHKDTEKYLSAQTWPGNVRQLKNVIERVLILGESSGDIEAEELPAQDVSSEDDSRAILSPAIATLPLREARELFEREYLLTQINRFGGNISRTSTFVGMERSALHRKLKSLGVMTGNKQGGRVAYVSEDAE
jgi:two-component system nitrogen regulation response regulator GlnG